MLPVTINYTYSNHDFLLDKRLHYPHLFAPPSLRTSNLPSTRPQRYLNPILWTAATLGNKEKEQQLREYLWKTEQPCNPQMTLTPDAVTDYEYDYDNRLVEVSLPTNSDTVAYTYDAMGRRLTKVFTYHNGANTDVTTYKYHYIGSQITEIEIDAIRNPGEGQSVLRNEEVKIHLGANSQPISYEWVKHVGESTTSATYYYHYDIHGNVLKVTDSSENTKITYTYDTLGSILTETNPDSILNFFTFRGASQTIWEPETGMYYSGGYYRPDTGTALQGTGAPVLTNPSSSAMLNAVALATSANAQLAAHAMVSAATAGSASGGQPGGFAPPPGPSDGISRAGKTSPISPNPNSMSLTTEDDTCGVKCEAPLNITTQSFVVYRFGEEPEPPPWDDGDDDNMGDDYLIDPDYKYKYYRESIPDEIIDQITATELIIDGIEVGDHPRDLIEEIERIKKAKENGEELSEEELNLLSAWEEKRAFVQQNLVGAVWYNYENNEQNRIASTYGPMLVSYQLSGQPPVLLSANAMDQTYDHFLSEPIYGKALSWERMSKRGSFSYVNNSNSSLVFGFSDNEGTFITFEMIGTGIHTSNHQFVCGMGSFKEPGQNLKEWDDLGYWDDYDVDAGDGDYCWTKSGSKVEAWVKCSSGGPWILRYELEGSVLDGWRRNYFNWSFSPLGWSNVKNSRIFVRNYR